MKLDVGTAEVGTSEGVVDDSAELATDGANDGAIEGAKDDVGMADVGSSEGASDSVELITDGANVCSTVGAIDAVGKEGVGRIEGVEVVLPTVIGVKGLVGIDEGCHVGTRVELGSKVMTMEGREEGYEVGMKGVWNPTAAAKGLVEGK